MKIFLAIHVLNVDEKAVFDSDSFSIVLDTGANFSCSPDIKDFYEYKEIKNMTATGLGTQKVYGIGKVK